MQKHVPPRIVLNIRTKNVPWIVPDSVPDNVPWIVPCIVLIPVPDSVPDNVPWIVPCIVPCIVSFAYVLSVLIYRHKKKISSQRCLLIVPWNAVFFEYQDKECPPLDIPWLPFPNYRYKGHSWISPDTIPDTVPCIGAKGHSLKDVHCIRTKKWRFWMTFIVSEQIPFLILFLIPFLASEQRAFPE